MKDPEPCSASSLARSRSRGAGWPAIIGNRAHTARHPSQRALPGVQRVEDEVTSGARPDLDGVAPEHNEAVTGTTETAFKGSERDSRRP